MNKLETIIQACIKANESILDLKFGCHIDFEGEKIVIDVNGDIVKTKTTDVHKNHIKIIGRPITLADVLLALEGNLKDRQLLKPHWENQHNLLIKWNLLKNLNDQDPSTIDFLFNLLKHE